MDFIGTLLIFLCTLLALSLKYEHRWNCLRNPYRRKCARCGRVEEFYTMGYDYPDDKHGWWELANYGGNGLCKNIRGE